MLTLNNLPPFWEEGFEKVQDGTASEELRRYYEEKYQAFKTIYDCLSLQPFCTDLLACSEEANDD